LITINHVIDYYKCTYHLNIYAFLNDINQTKNHQKSASASSSSTGGAPCWNNDMYIHLFIYIYIYMYSYLKGEEVEEYNDKNDESE
jgi:hypothetical protein